VVAERLRKQLQQIEVPGYGKVTGSFGVATFPTHASSRDTLVVAADRALYHSKNSGRNSVSLPMAEGGEIDYRTAAGPDQSPDLIDALQRL
jgi:PleD family two-component response regulator